jgi:hypothetical protein
MSAGVDPRGKPSSAAKADSDQRSDPKLRAAWQNYRDSQMLRKARSQETVAGYEDHVLRLIKNGSISRSLNLGMSLCWSRNGLIGLPRKVGLI